MSLSWTLQKVALHYFFVLGVNVGNEQYFVASQNFPFIPLSTLYQDSESFDSLGLGIWGGGGNKKWVGTWGFSNNEGRG